MGKRLPSAADPTVHPSYGLWANGLGPKNLPEPHGAGDTATNINDLPVGGGQASCQLTVGGIAAIVDYFARCRRCRWPERSQSASRAFYRASAS
jgi:hypothetical protein